VVDVTPDPGRCSARPRWCATYVCDWPSGAGCFELLNCTSLTFWPYFTLMNSGGASLCWSSPFSNVVSNPGNATISLSPSGGNLLAHGPIAFDVNFTSGGVTVDIPTQCSHP